jgi:DNA-binding MarR family transcriptional regulator
MHIFRRRSTREAEVRQAESVEAGLAVLPASSRPLGTPTRNMLRALATEVVDRTEASRAASLGLDTSGSAALVLISREPGLSVGDLAVRLGRSHSATVRVVDRLEEARLVKRSRTRSDARRATLALTVAGGRRLAAAALPADESMDVILRDLTSGERVLLQRILGKVVAQLPGGVTEGGRICRYCDPLSCGADGCPRARLL